MSDDEDEMMTGSVRIAGGLGVEPPPHLADPPTSGQNLTRGVEFQPPT